MVHCASFSMPAQPVVSLRDWYSANSSGVHPGPSVQAARTWPLESASTTAATLRAFFQPEANIVIGVGVLKNFSYLV